MLKLNPDPQFKADVEITVPGAVEMGSISLTFKYRNRKELSALWGSPEDGEKPKKDDLTKKKDIDLFMEMVAGWDGIDAEFNKKNAEIFLNNYPAAANEIAIEYSKLLVVSRIKN